MTDLHAPRHPARLATVLGALIALCACVDRGASGDDDDTETGGEESQPCAAPGSVLFDEAKPVPPVMASAGGTGVACSSGWATDAPQRDATWTMQLGAELVDLWGPTVDIAAHPDGGVVVVAQELFGRYDADGAELWSSTAGAPIQGQAMLVVEEAGTVVLSIYNWSNDTATLRRYDADGGSIGAVDVAWNSTYPSVWALDTYGPNLVIGAVDEDAEGSFEQTLLHLDPADNVLLRKSTWMSNGGILAVNDSGTVAFGRGPAFMLSIDDGAVLGMLTPSAGFPQAFTGGGDDFYMVGGSAGDLAVGRYSSFGGERWLQTYDRAGGAEQGRDVAASNDTVVVVGTTQALAGNEVWTIAQPLIIAANLDGDAVWADRIGVFGEATSVTIGSEGEIYVGGSAESVNSSTSDTIAQVRWLRRYD